MGEIDFLQVFEENFLCHGGFSTLRYEAQAVLFLGLNFHDEQFTFWL